MGRHPERGDYGKPSREKRLAEALKANLKRRKAQQRNRSAAPEGNAGDSRKENAKESG